MSVHTFKSPWQAWVLIIVLLTSWKGERGMWIGIGITGVAWLLSAIPEWLKTYRKR